jgi:hypothetical protein
MLPRPSASALLLACGARLQSPILSFEEAGIVFGLRKNAQLLQGVREYLLIRIFQARMKLTQMTTDQFQ